MEKEILICPNSECKSKLKKTGSPYVRCATCRMTFFSFCHQFPNKISQYVACQKCPNQLYYFFCVKCKETLCFKKYRMGSISKCKCGFEGCYVVCNRCKNTECYPPNNRYEGISWCCERCKQPFNFMTCDQCFHPVYANNFREQQRIRCENLKCKVNLKVKKCKMCQQIYLNSRNQLHCSLCQKRSNSTDKLKMFLRQISKQQIKSPQSPPPPSIQNRQQTNLAPNNLQNQNIKSKQLSNTVQPTNSLTNKTNQMDKSFGKQIQSLCKVCLDKQANFINTKCFHMSCCETCAPSMNNICPICRAEGEFKKVFR